MNKLSIFLITVILLSIIFFNVYSLSLNKTCHTGFNISILFYVYALLSVFAIITILWCKHKKVNYKFFLILFFICIMGMINIKVYEKYNIMMEYEVWTEKGMPEKFH